MSTAVGYSIPVRVYYEDTDAAGVVYYAAYLRFMERARSDWLRARGLDVQTLASQEHLLFVVTSVHLNYLRPARLGDLLEVSVVPERIGRASLLVGQQVRRGEQVLCEGQIRLATLDARSMAPCRLPSFVTSGLESCPT